MSAELLKIPQELYDLAIDKTIFNKEEHKVKHFVRPKVVTTKVPHPMNPNRFITKQERVWDDVFSHSWTNSLYGAGLLNMIAFYTLDYGYSFVEKTESGDWLFQDNNGNKMLLSIGDKFNMTVDNGIREVTYKDPIQETKNGVTTKTTRVVTFSSQNLAEKLGTTEYEVIKWINNLGWVWTGTTVNTDTHVANVFSTIERENDVVTADVLVNGKSFSTLNFGALIFPFGKAGQGFVVDWVLYNEHELVGTPKWISEGDMGEAARVRIASKSDVRATVVNVVAGTESKYDDDTHTFTYDSRKGAVLIFQPQLKPAQGKNDIYEVCLDLNTGETYLSRFEALKNAKGLVNDEEL